MRMAAGSVISDCVEGRGMGGVLKGLGRCDIDPFLSTHCMHYLWVLQKAERLYPQEMEGSCRLRCCNMSPMWNVF